MKMLRKAKYLIILSFFCFFISCKNAIKKNDNSVEAIVITDSSIETLTANKFPEWILQFQQLRQAIYQNDTLAVKSFFNFPIIDSLNSIWYIAYKYDEKLIGKLPNYVKPFTEKDFDKYYKILFSSSIKQSLLTIKSDSLLANNEVESYKEFEEKGMAYKAYVSLDKKTNELTIGEIYHGTQKDNFDGEGAYFYVFKIDNNGKLKFLRVTLAG